MIKITVLHNELKTYNDDKSGLSLLIEADDKRVLFDVSMNDDILKNAERLGISLKVIDFVVVSHSHFDHTDGFRFIKNKNAVVIGHPNCFAKRYYEGKEVGCPLSVQELKNNFKQIIQTKKPYEFLPNFIFLGQIPRKTDFEGKTPIGKLESNKDDFVIEDSALAIKTDKGIIVVSGCSHSGICNIITHAKEVCKQEKVRAVIGGFHLFNKNAIDKTIEFFKSQNIEQVYPMHCLNEYAFSEFEKIGGKRIYCGGQITFD